MTPFGGVLFRVNAGPRIGLGHFRRSISLAEALAGQGLRSHFLMEAPASALSFALSLRQSAELLAEGSSWSLADLKRTRQACAHYGFPMVIVDSSDVAPDYLEQLRAADLFVVVRDDLARTSFSCQMVVNGNADAQELPYRSADGQTSFLLGPEYAVLPKEYRQPRKRLVRDPAKNLLILLGGADPHHLMPRLLQLTDEIPGDFTVTALCGPFFENVPGIQQAARTARHPVQLVEGSRSLYPLISQADLAISGGGQALYELACAGCPAVAIEVGPDQAGHMRALKKAGSLYIAGRAGDPHLPDQIREALLLLLSDPSRRAAMTKAGQTLVDGQGALRVVQQLTRAIEVLTL